MKLLYLLVNKRFGSNIFATFQICEYFPVDAVMFPLKFNCSLVECERKLKKSQSRGTWCTTYPSLTSVILTVWRFLINGDRKCIKKKEMTINTGSARLPTPSEFRIYVVIQHTPVNTKHNSLSLIKIHRKTLTWFTVSQCDAVCCSITAMPKAMRSSDNCNLQWGMRKGGGREWRERRKQWVEIKSTAADSEKQWQWICLHSMLSLLLTLTTL